MQDLNQKAIEKREEPGEFNRKKLQIVRLVSPVNCHLEPRESFKHEGQIFKPSDMNLLESVTQLLDDLSSKQLSQNFIMVSGTQDFLIINKSQPLFTPLQYFEEYSQAQIRQQKIQTVLYFSIFSDLQHLTIQDHYVQNCEFMQFLNAPNLSVCLFKCYTVFNIKSFFKSNSHSLKNLDFSLCSILSFNLSRLNLPQKISCLRFESDSDDIKNEDLSSLFKVQPQYMFSITLNRERIKQKKVLQRFRQRFAYDRRRVAIHTLQEVRHQQN